MDGATLSVSQSRTELCGSDDLMSPKIALELQWLERE